MLKPMALPRARASSGVSARLGELPYLIEAKSAGDFTNTNNRERILPQAIRAIGNR